ncbi:type 1 phosphatases regulator YPI1 [Helicoverpa zea]|uniref:type 1 phosphatases regulator YPI1 n=1 Tax=Helicoverpa zea TaxID=7113 RepID=UPI001F57280D|nr:type 1 phosphatases regulator YPI1 [Helicoverpa zea]
MGERQRLAGPEDMATTSTAVATVPPQTQEEPVERVAVITLRPTRPETRKKVVWTEDTVDNEHMNKKKSKCCCIYEKPKKFGESDSEDSDDELENCSGHVEKKRGKRYHHHDHDCPHHSAEAATVTITIAEQETVTPEPTATITLQPSEDTPQSAETTPQAPITTPKPTEEAPKATPQPSEATPTPAPAPPDKKD